MKVNLALLAVGLSLCSVVAGPTSGADDLLAPGKSTTDVRTKMGAPTDVRVGDAGEEVWEYARRPSPYETYIVRFASDGTLREITQVIDGKTFARIKVGSSTKAQIRDLLGPPWRTVMFADDDDDEDNQEIWEYRGRDTMGTYKFHVEFDGKGITRLAVKIPDGARGKVPRKDK
jgi:outer membrane protein assembly factor BamE (lipoprotein component of BamABCDE complex)